MLQTLLLHRQLNHHSQLKWMVDLKSQHPQKQYRSSVHPPPHFLQSAIPDKQPLTQKMHLFTAAQEEGKTSIRFSAKEGEAKAGKSTEG